MATPIFIGRGRLLERARQAIDSGLDVYLVGEVGSGKTALARRVAPGAIWVEHPSPPSDVLATLLLHAYNRAWWTPPDRGADDPDDLDEAALVKLIRKMGQKAATEAAVQAFERAPIKAVIAFDNFDAAPASVVRLVRALAQSATVLAVGSAPRAHQKPFLFSCTRIEVPRLSARETEELSSRLLDDYGVPAPDKPRVVRHLVEESQGLPAVVYEVLKRAGARGDLSLSSLRREEVNGFKVVDMTPGLVLLTCGLAMFRGVARGWGDADWRVFLAASGGILMAVRFYAFRLSRTRPS